MEPPSSSPVRDKAGLPVEQKTIIASSPLRAHIRTGRISSTQKIKKPATVTPRRLNKFFAPRNTASGRGTRQSKAGRELRDITQNGANTRKPGAPLTLEDDSSVVDENYSASSSRPFKRRKVSTDLASSPPQSSPLKHVQTGRQTGGQIQIFEDYSDVESLPDLFDQLQPFPRPIRRLREPGASLRLMERSFGGHEALSRHRRGPDHGADWRAETSNFVTNPNDMHAFRNTSLPFCTSACNTNTLVAVGDEEGSIRLIDSAPSARFQTSHVSFRVHRNAIMDLSFSSDDILLATASGDQTGRVVNMQTQQTTMCILSGHKNSVKQVRFRPNNDKMITTSARDGTVQLWDLRHGKQSAVQTVRVGRRQQIDADGRAQPDTRYGLGLDVGYGHRSLGRPFESDMRAELSITSFQHMPQGREHLLITSSEVDASVKVWDLRNVGKRNPIPLSSTPVPDAHKSSRHFGINTMALSGDGSRLYTVCRDSSIYAYSTNSLLLGHTPEMSLAGHRRLLKKPGQGLAPLYSFKHPSLRVGTFYIKAALRPAKDGRGEVLAVGNTDCKPILFPTDERHLPRGGRPLISHPEDDDDEEVDFADFDLPTARRSSTRKSTPATTTTTSQDPNVFTQGTALVEAHKKEVTSVTWTNEGNLISISDDFTARCWREDAGRARDLRTGGERSGGRWRCGWAEAEKGWDEDEG
ncbi:unnamed protein product [Zymoseptoria tritici ST99CH_1A5]|uniref:Uncharacterized protein n=1 Tax=Zymoseptoria tritici ST99CH_1A5 TaxID=1276529 RepID=A0A1Y6LAR1_ZYMTR|nr:unnamed protein product [Zymoseptoria tritici ST99CH_1A5]